MRILNKGCWQFLLFSLVFTFFALHCDSSNSAIASPKTVTDYYYLLPDSYFENECSKDQRKNILFPKNAGSTDKSIVDTQNDYIRVNLDSLGTLEVAVFRYKKRDWIAVRRYYEGCCLWFFTYREGQWKDVTKQILPVRFNSKYNYSIPRCGTTIQVHRDLWPSKKRGQKVYDLVWRQGRFLKRS